MNKKIKSLVLAAVMGLSLTTVAVVPTTVEAASAGAAQTLIGGAVAYAYVSTAFNKMDNSKEGQEQSLARAKKQTGYLEDSAAQARVQRIMKTLEASPSVKRSYVVYANPSDDFNAFATVGRVMSVNKGALDLLDDDELAYVMAHEISHGEHKDIVNGLKKQVGLSTAVSLAAGGGGNAAILSNIAGNYMENQVFTMGQEKAADELGFKILSESPYNVGAAAASMAVLRNKYGDLYREGLNQVFSPNNHPKTSSRVKDNIDRMYTYSGLEGGPPCFPQGFTCLVVLWIQSHVCKVSITGLSPSAAELSNSILLPHLHLMTVLNPGAVARSGLASFPFARRY